MTDPAPWLRRLAARRALARQALLFEQLWPAIWPAVGVAGAFLCAALLDLPPLLPPWLHIALLVGTGAAILGLLARGLWRIRLPDDAAADRRLERESGLAHRPLATLTDRPAQPDPVGDALWHAHLSRIARQVNRLRVGRPRPGLARRDRKALRGALVVALVASAVVAGRDAPTRLAAAMEPSLPRAVIAATPTELRAWITPPAYTRLAPIFLKTEGGSIPVPAGSHLTVSVTGGSAIPTLDAQGHADSFTVLDPTSFQAEKDLVQPGPVAVRRNGRELAAWDIAIVADQPPAVAWNDRPTRAPMGQQVRLPWKATDDYGVTGLRVEMRLDARPLADPISLALPLTGGNPKALSGASQQDLTAHPWAGLPVTARLVATDAASQAGSSDDAPLILPERPFYNPIARMIIELRKTLSINPEDRGDALAGLDELMLKPELFGQDTGALLNLDAIYYLLVRNRDLPAVAEAQERMWLLALHLEEGQTEQTARALEQARQAAREAMREAQREPTDANKEKLEQRLRELQQAIDRHMQALLEEARRNENVMPFDPEAHQLTNHDLNRLAERAQEAAREGRMDEAQRRMEELEQLLDQMRGARAAQGQNQQQQQGSNQRRQRGRQQMGAVQDMVGRQGGLLDHAESRVDQNQRPRGAAPTQPTDSATQQQADRRVQQALRRSLGELMQQFGDLTGEVPPALSEADQAMRDAGTALGQGQDQSARGAQQRAIEALQKGAREMGQAMARQFGPGGQQGDDGDAGDPGGAMMGMMRQDGRGDGRSAGPLPGSPDRANPNGRDPLGRHNQGSSTDNADVTVPEERERQRTQAIQEELRRRGAERERPRQELDYIDRLLKQF